MLPGHFKARIRLQIEIEIGLKFNQSEEKKSISGLMNFALIGLLLLLVDFLWISDNIGHYPMLYRL